MNIVNLLMSWLDLLGRGVILHNVFWVSTPALINFTILSA